MSLEGSQVRAIAEISPAARARAQKAYPGIKVTCRCDGGHLVAGNRRHCRRLSGLDALRTDQGRSENGKHVFVEKPFTSNAAQGEELMNLAPERTSRSWWITPSFLPAR